MSLQAPADMKYTCFLLACTKLQEIFLRHFTYVDTYANADVGTIFHT